MIIYTCNSKNNKLRNQPPTSFPIYNFASITETWRPFTFSCGYYCCYYETNARRKIYL